jgi:hypothetical protein
LTGEIEVLGENLPRRHFVHHKSHLPYTGANPGRRGGKPATNRFSYGAALFVAGLFIYLIFVPEDGDDMFLRNVGFLSPDYILLCPTRNNFWFLRDVLSGDTSRYTWISTEVHHV